jgi:hypothetical protein
VGVGLANGCRLESDTINAAFQKVTKQSEHAFDDLRDAVKTHQENHMKKDDYKLMDFYEVRKWSLIQDETRLAYHFTHSLSMRDPLLQHR